MIVGKVRIFLSPSDLGFFFFKIHLQSVLFKSDQSPFCLINYFGIKQDKCFP